MFSKKKPYENDDFFDSNSRQNYETEEKPEKDSFFKANLLLNEDKKRDISISEDKKKGEKFYNNDNPLDMYYKEPKSNMHVSKPMAEMNKTSNYPLDFSKKPDNLNLSSAFNKSGVPNDEKSFVNKYRDNIRKIFDECSERGEIEINKLKGLLLEAGIFY